MNNNLNCNMKWLLRCFKSNGMLALPFLVIAKINY